LSFIPAEGRSVIVVVHHPSLPEQHVSIWSFDSYCVSYWVWWLYNNLLICWCQKASSLPEYLWFMWFMQAF